MKRDVVLSIQGRQRYGEQEPETIELVTGGTMEFRLDLPVSSPPSGWSRGRSR